MTALENRIGIVFNRVACKRTLFSANIAVGLGGILSSAWTGIQQASVPDVRTGLVGCAFMLGIGIAGWCNTHRPG